MKKMFIIFLFLVVFMLIGCNYIVDNEKALYISNIYLSPSDRGIAVNVSFNQKYLAVAKDDIVSVGILVLKEEVHTASEITLEKNDYDLSSDGFKELTTVVINLEEKDYNSPFAIRAYFTYNDKEGELHTVYSSVYSQINPYKLAKIDDSEYAHEITRMVEGEPEDEYVPVRVNFDLNGGIWTNDILHYVILNQEPDAALKISQLNDTTGVSYTLLNKNALFYQYFYKIFIKRVEGTNIYRVVAIDAATKDIVKSGVSDYDYVLAVHEFCTDETAFSKIKNYATSGPIGMIVIFDGDIDSYQEGTITSSFYPVTHDETMEIEFLNSDLLPRAVKDGFHFGGWSDGVDICTVFPRYKASQNITAVSYTAVWELYSIEEFVQYINGLLPEVVTGDLDLPLSYSGYNISWTSSHPEIITNTGVYKRPIVQTVVTLTAKLVAPNLTESVNFQVTANEYKKLISPIASSYIYRNYHLVNDAFFETLDIINCAFITATASGSLHGSNFLNNVQNYIIPKAREYGCWVIVSVAPDSQWTAMAADPVARETFANNIVDLINEYGFDGVDIDWEGSVQGTNFVLLMEKVYTKVKANNPRHLVTAAIAGGMWQPPNYNLRQSGPYIDYINMMTYSLVSNNGYYQNNLYPRSGYHNSTHEVGRTLNTCSIAESVAAFKNNYQVPAAKIIVGVAFYGVKQVLTDGNWKASGSVYYSSLNASYLNNRDYTAYFDEVAGVPYILKNDGKMFISYDDPRSIKLKCDYIIDQGLGGMMYWENGCDNTGILLAAMRQGLKK